MTIERELTVQIPKKWEKNLRVFVMSHGGGIVDSKDCKDIHNDYIWRIIDFATKYMCGCHMRNITWDELQKVRKDIRHNAMDMITSNLKASHHTTVDEGIS